MRGRSGESVYSYNYKYKYDMARLSLILGTELIKEI